jgi:BirA family biotin operon repressor/biotin-[acetyl-CoA-carboxylase] ligase
VIECDGISHDRSPERDAARDRWMAAEGYRVLRFTNAEVLGNVEGVVAVIREEVRRNVESSLASRVHSHRAP